MKVVQINSVCGYGSTGRIAVEISKKLNDNDIENYIFYGQGQSEYKNAVKFGNHSNMALHKIGTRLCGKHGFYSRVSTQRLIKQLDDIEPDIVHLHNLHGHYLNVQILFYYLSNKNIKVFWTLHDCWSFTGHCAHFDYINCEKWKLECHNCPQLREYPKSLIFDRSKESFYDKKRIFNSVKDMTLITPSHWLKELVKQSFLKTYQVKVINNGINLSSFKPTRSSFKVDHSLDNKFIILGVSSLWNTRKGFDFFLKLSSTLEEDEIIVLVGLNSDQIKNLPPNILGVSRTNSVKELTEIYSAADVFVNPTLEDNFPTTNLEALACGTPVITFDTGGSPEAIGYQTGYIVEKGNIEHLRTAIQEVKENGKKFYTHECIKRAEDKYDAEQSYQSYVSLYLNVITGNIGLGELS